jgi:acetolactate synthase-1/2/3 large subunit
VRSGGQVVVSALERNGIDLAFCLPGESFLPVLDALHDSSIRLITSRHEQGAANAAEAYGKLTGRPGVCLVTRGPGATQAAVGVHTARQDSTPMLLLVGDIPRAFRGREAWQEVDYERVFGGFAKAAFTLQRADTVAEDMACAIETAVSGRPGPVVVAMPEDVLQETTGADDAPTVEIDAPAPTVEDLARLRELLAGAERPLVVVGEGGWTQRTGEDALAFCEANRLPVACAFRCQDFVDNHSPSYVGILGVAMDERIAGRLRDADLVLAIGGRLGEVPSRRYTLVEPPRPRQTLIHVHPDPAELGFVYETDLAIASGVEAFAARLRELEPVEPRWAEWTAAARADYEDNLRHEPMEGPLDLGEVMAFLRQRLPADAIQTCGAGNFTVWAHRFAEFRQYGTQLGPRSGSMGYGLPAAVAAKLVHPEREVVCFTGDGDFVMSSPELATAVQYGLPIVVLLVNNGMYATIRMHQERVYPRRVVGTDLVNPDFPALAAAYGAHGERVERTEDFEGAFERALASGKPAVLELPVDPERISPRVRLSELQAREA